MENPIVPSAEQSPVSQGRTLRKPSLRMLVIGGIIIVLLASAAALFLVRVDGHTLIDRIIAQSELGGVYIVERTAGDINPQSFGFFGLKPKSIEGIAGSLDDYASGGGVKAAVVTSADTSLQEVWLLGDEPKILATGPAAKSSVAVSPDGTFIAYAAQADGSSAFAGSLSSWTVHIIDLKTGRDIELGSGFDPEFFVRDGVPYLLFTSAEGVVVNSLVQRDSFSGFITPFTLVDSVDYTAKISSDGMYFALKDPSTRGFLLYSVYRVSSDLPLGIEPLMSPANQYTDVIFVRGAAFGVDNQIQGSATVWKIALTGSHAETDTYTFPTTYANRFIR